jgi:hypothetical protein
MSVENRIFWLIVGLLALYFVFAGNGRSAVRRFIQGVFGGSVAPAPPTSAPTPAPAPSGQRLSGDVTHPATA